MVTTSGVAEIAALVGDPARANMLLALMDGRALTATELARAAGILPQTASSHLARLTDAGLLTVERQGRHRYHRITSLTVARMLEGIMAVAAAHPGPRALPLRTGPADQDLRRARTCYDHLAGQIAVAMADRMVERRHIDLSPDGGALTETGAAFLRTLDIDPARAASPSARKRVFCRPCLDWSERRFHIAGSLGTAMMATYLAKDWMRRTAGSRTVTVTPAGRHALTRAFDLDPQIWALQGSSSGS